MECETPTTGQETVLNQLGVKKFAVVRQVAQYSIKSTIEIVDTIETQNIGLETAQGQQMGLAILRSHKEYSIILRSRQEYSQKRPRYWRGRSTRNRLTIERIARSAAWNSIMIHASPLLSFADIPYADHVQRGYTR